MMQLTLIENEICKLVISPLARGVIAFDSSASNLWEAEQTSMPLVRCQ
jgi:hypothetical protein